MRTGRRSKKYRTRLQPTRREGLTARKAGLDAEASQDKDLPGVKELLKQAYDFAKTP